MKAIIQQVANVLANIDEEKSLTDVRIKEVEAEGYLVVNGSLAVTDYRTEKVVKKFRTVNALDKGWSKKWFHIDRLMEEVDDIIPSVDRVKGLPDSLIYALQGWVFEHEEEARAWVITAEAR